MAEGGRGVLYIATGAAHTEAARQSAASVRATNPGLGVALFTDQTVSGPEFDRVEPVAAPHIRSKVDYLPETPFAETLYLDTDTRVLDDLGEMFRLLERFEIALAQRAHVPGIRAGRPPVPSSFPQGNGGVMLYRSSPAALQLLGDWRAAYAEAGFKVDQITLRELLWASDIRFAVLPARFNTRRYTWLNHWFSNAPRPVILHTNRFHPTKFGPVRAWLDGLTGPYR
ncbi:MAG TPA: putative nucleotide-diphospho-sugar transferase [Amaricoccus sp.]|nr:putative nucleotide-diphospho-sugar transferase [Amaricoccus sp.]